MSNLDTDEVTVRVRELRRTIRRAVEMLQGSTISVDDYSPAEHESLISFTGVPGYCEVKRYTSVGCFESPRTTHRRPDD